MISRMDRFFFGPVAAARPFLFARLFLIIFSVDMWLDFVARGWRYGSGGFNVSHFPQLDAVLPFPSPGLYVGLTILASFGALMVALVRWNRLVLFGVFVLFTCTWLISQFDSYQHHYLMSLVLLALVCFPRLDPKDVTGDADADADTHADTRDRDDTPPVRAVSAWGYVLLGCQIAIVYTWTAIAKMDATWVGGHTVKKIVTSTTPAEPVDGTAGWFWVAMAVGGILVELALAGLYLVSLTQDRRRGARWRWLSIATLALALSLHVGIELMPLSIGIFSYYMVLVACVFLPPQQWVHRVAMTLIRAVQSLGRVIDGATKPLRTRASGVAAIAIAAAAVVAVGHLSTLPGAAAACWLIGALLAALTLGDAWRDRLARTAPRRFIVTLLFLAVMSAYVFGTDLRPSFHYAMARERQLRDQPEQALRLYRTALDLDPDAELAASIHVNWGLLLENRRRVDEALSHYRAAVHLHPASAEAHYNLASILSAQGQTDDAITHYRHAITARPGDAPTHYDLGVALHKSDQLDAAIEQFRLAAAAEPDMLGAHNNAAALLISRDRLDEAVPHLRAAARLQPDHLPTLNNLAMILATSDNPDVRSPDEAVELARRAVEITERKDPLILRTLGEAYFAAGHRELAVAVTELARELVRAQAPEHPIIDQLSKQLERFRAGGS